MRDFRDTKPKLFREANDTIDEVLQQMNNDHSIYEMENEIFELETAKAKYTHGSLFFPFLNLKSLFFFITLGTILI